MTKNEEEAFLAPFFEAARQGGVLVVSVIHEALEQRLKRKVALASAYNLLHRHGWRKLTPDKRHVKADMQAQEEWKKTPCPARANRKDVGQTWSHQIDVSRRGALWSYCGEQALLVSQTSQAGVSHNGVSGIHVCIRCGEH